MQTFRPFALAAALAALAACSDSTGPSGNAGALRFDYSGARNGSYAAEGEYQLSGSSVVKQSFAVATNTTFSGDPVTIVLSYSPVTSSVGDVAELIVPTATGTYPLVDFCESTDCAEGFLSFSVNPDLDVDANSDDFTFVSGTVNVTSVSGGRVRGTFSGIAESDYDASRRVTVTGGSFDAPIVSAGGFLSTRVRAPLQAQRNRLRARRGASPGNVWLPSGSGRERLPRGSVRRGAHRTCERPAARACG